MSNLQLRNACDQFIAGALRSYVTIACLRSAEPYRDNKLTISCGDVDIQLNSFTGINGSTTRIQVIISKGSVPIIDIPRITDNAIWRQLVDTYTIADISELLESVELVIRVYHPLK